MNYDMSKEVHKMFVLMTENSYVLAVNFWTMIYEKNKKNSADQLEPNTVE
jgi:hypothetical protein